MNAGFIGLGSMGAPMARNLQAAGHLVAIWNRSRAKADALAAELGLIAPETPGGLSSQVDVIFICVSADDDVLSVVDAVLPGLKPRSIVIDHSTVSSKTARLAASRIEERGATFLDIPVSGGVEGARSGTLAMMAGGSAASLERVRPMLETMASRIVHMGDVGSGQSTKAVNQIMCAGINQAVTEALAFAQAQRLDLAKVIDVVRGGAAGNWFLEKRGLTMTRGEFAPGFKLALHHKDLRICLAMAQQVGIPLPLSEMTLRDYARLMAQDHGDEDISALFRLKSSGESL